MKRITPLFIIIVVVLAVACTAGNNKTSTQEEKTMVSITDSSIIYPAFKATADASTNFSLLGKHYEQYPERWNIAFQYLASVDVDSLPLGRTDLNDDVYVAVSEYKTKNHEDALFESHQQYIDIQYLVSGKEYIGLTRDSNIPVESVYNAEKDIAFYRYEGGNNLLATPEKYFIFFPEDIHRPCMKVDDNESVKKIVVKIRF